MTFHYSTENLSQHRRVQYWHDSVAAHLIPADAKYSDPDSFRGSLRGGELGLLTICEMNAASHTFVRSERSVRSAPVEDFVATFLRRGSMRYSQGDRSVSASEGSIVLLDAGRPFIHEMHDINSLIVRLPRRQFLARCPSAEYMTGIEIGQSNTITALLNCLVNEAFEHQSQVNPVSVEIRLADALMDLLVVAIEQKAAHQAARDTSKHHLAFRRAVRFIEINLDDYEMSVETIAGGIGTSPRTLARAFSAQHSTVMNYVLKRRLEMSYGLLSSGKAEQVTQAAYQAGFSDLSHFTRAFKAAYGLTPGAVLKATKSTSSTALVR